VGKSEGRMRGKCEWMTKIGVCCWMEMMVGKNRTEKSDDR